MKTSLSEWLLRIGLAGAFLYPAVDGLVTPENWIGYFPKFVLSLPVDAHLLLISFEAIEIILAVWVLSGWKTRFPAIIMAIMLLAIVGFNTVDFLNLFRDVSIALAALALAIFPRPTAR